MSDVRTLEDDEAKYGLPLLAVYQIKLSQTSNNISAKTILSAKETVKELLDKPKTLPIVKQFIRLYLQPTDYQFDEPPKAKKVKKKKVKSDAKKEKVIKSQPSSNQEVEHKTEAREPKKVTKTPSSNPAPNQKVKPKTEVKKEKVINPRNQEVKPKTEVPEPKKKKVTKTPSSNPVPNQEVKSEASADWKSFVDTHGKLHVMKHGKKEKIIEFLSKYKFVTGRDKKGCIAIKASVLHRIGRVSKYLESSVKEAIDSGKIDMETFWKELFYVYCVTENDGKGIAPFKKFCHLTDQDIADMEDETTDSDHE